MVTQLYTKNLEDNGKYCFKKVNWSKLKITPNYKIKEILEKDRYTHCHGTDANNELNNQIIEEIYNLIR